MRPIAYETIEELDSSIPKGWTKQKRIGRKGQRQLTYKAIYVDGKEITRELESKKVLKKPTDEIMEIGAKEESSGTAESAFDPSPTFISIPTPARSPEPPLTSFVILSAERAKSLQAKYPGIPAGWSIDNYRKTVRRVNQFSWWTIGRELTTKEIIEFFEFCSSGKIPAARQKVIDGWFPQE